MSGSFTSVGPINPDTIGFSVASTRMKSASVRFQGAPGELVLEDKWFRDKATLQVKGASPDALVGDLRKLSEAAGLPFNVEKVRLSTGKQEPIPALDLAKGESLENIAHHNRQERDKVAGVEVGQEYYIASLSTRIKDAGDTLNGIARDKGDRLRFIEVAEKDGGDYGFYTDKADHPTQILGDILQSLNQGARTPEPPKES
ncbi:MAG: hypothetical protein U0931_31615 [Vulcanimicrobiota bacterium]